MRQVLTITVLAVLLTAGHIVAQNQASPRESLAHLQFLVGNYATETSMPASPAAPKGATGKGTSVIVWGLDSMFLLINEQSENSLFGKYKGHGVLGFDMPSQQFVLSMFNNFGDHPVYKGNFAGDTLVLQTKVPMPSHSFDQKLMWYKDGDAVKLRVLNDMGKGFDLVIEQVAVPVTQKSK